MQPNSYPLGQVFSGWIPACSYVLKMAKSTNRVIMRQLSEKKVNLPTLSQVRSLEYSMIETRDSAGQQ